MSRIAIGYEDFARFQQTTKGVTRKLISIMRGRVVDRQFIDDMMEWLKTLIYLVTTTNPELKSSVINDVSVVRCAFSKLDIFGKFGEFSSHLFNIVLFIQENDVNLCCEELRYMINMIEFSY